MTQTRETRDRLLPPLLHPAFIAHNVLYSVLYVLS